MTIERLLFNLGTINEKVVVPLYHPAWHGWDEFFALVAKVTKKNQEGICTQRDLDELAEQVWHLLPTTRWLATAYAELRLAGYPRG
jgi:hypothetical protein